MYINVRGAVVDTYLFSYYIETNSALQPFIYILLADKKPICLQI
jgi:hypothetical protein